MKRILVFILFSIGYLSYTTAQSCACSISGTTTICEEETTNLSAVISGMHADLATDCTFNGTINWSTSGSSTLSTTTGGSIVVTGVNSSPGGLFPVPETISISAPMSEGGTCNATILLIVNPLPDIGIVDDAICIGESTQASIGQGQGLLGTWSVTGGGVSAVSTNPILNEIADVTGLVAGGPYNVTFTNVYGCAASIPVSVNPIPTINEPSGTICIGGDDVTLVVSNGAGPYTWTSSNASIASVDGTGTVIPVSVGTTTITVTDANGCSGFRTITVIGSTITDPSTTGLTTICAGSSVDLLGTPNDGGTWSVVGTGVSISNTGVLTAAANAPAGMATVNLIDSDGCPSTYSVTINNPVISPATSAICMGETFRFTVAGSSGQAINAWTPDNVVDETGAVSTTLANGMYNVTFTDNFGCTAEAAFTVADPPTLEDTEVCLGEMVTLNPGVSGDWTITNSTLFQETFPMNGVASVTLTTIATGATDITFTPANGCSITRTITVNPNPTLTLVSGSFCENGDIELLATGVPATTATTGNFGGTSPQWNPDPTNLNGVVATFPNTVGTVTFMDENGCMVEFVLPTIDANPTLTPQMICIGETIDLGPDGTWFSEDVSVATVDATGMVTGIEDGVANIIFTDASGCMATTMVTIKPAPVVMGDSWVCVGETVTLTASLIGSAAVPVGGIWSSINSGIATVAGGVVTGVAGGTTMIRYNLDDCIYDFSITVHENPIIMGDMDVCIDETIILTTDIFPNLTLANPWTTSNGNITIINTAIGTAPSIIGYQGEVTGVTTGGLATATTDVIFEDLNGCMAMVTITVHNPMITGLTEVCVGDVITLSVDATVGGGAWTSDNTNVTLGGQTATTIDLTGATAGMSTITYTDQAGCTTTYMVTVNALPIITGDEEVCLNANITLTSSKNGGLWTTNNGNVIFNNASTNPVTVTGINAGTSIITYTDADGCEDTHTVTIHPLPIISGDSWVCVNSTLQLGATHNPNSITPWVSSNTAFATISDDGLVTGVAVGTVSITYTDENGCQDSYNVIVHPLPVISGNTEVCVNSIIAITSTISGGTWSSNNANITFDNTGANPVMVTGAVAGTSTVTYTDANGCEDTHEVTINPLPVISPNPSVIICIAEMITLTATTNPAVNNAWISSNTSVASISSSGIVTGITGGSTTITYTDENNCTATSTVIVNAPVITGFPVGCVDVASVVLNGTGTPNARTPWTSSNTNVATITRSGLLLSVAWGYTDITFTDAAGCSITQTIEVCPVEKVIPTGYCEMIMDSTATNGSHVKMPTDCEPFTFKLLDCAGISEGVRFTDDAPDGLYADHFTKDTNGVITEGPRADTVTFCPQDRWHTVQIAFNKFDVAPGDGLTIYDGNLCEVQAGCPPTYVNVNGPAPSSAPGGGWVAAHCDPGVNKTGCLTIVFNTDNTQNKGTGWDALVTCYNRDIVLEAEPAKIQTGCDAGSGLASFNLPTITAECGDNGQTIDADYNFELRTGGFSVYWIENLANNVAPPSQVLETGTYQAIYRLFDDTTKQVETTFIVSEQTMVCNDQINISLNPGCDFDLTLDDILENPCETFPQDVFQYKVSAKFGSGFDAISYDGATSTTTGLGTPNISILTVPYEVFEQTGMTPCDGEGVLSVERIYKGRSDSKCITRLEFKDFRPPTPQLGFTPTIFIGCTAEEIKSLLQIGVFDDCDRTTQINLAVELATGDDPCMGNADTEAIITYSATDFCGNKSQDIEFRVPVKRSDRILRPDHIIASCEEETKDVGIPQIVKGYYVGSNFTPVDTIALSSTEYIRGYIARKEVEPIPSSSCGRKEYVHWKILDWCRPLVRPTQYDPQLLNFLDTLPPVIQLSDETYAKLEQKDVLTKELTILELNHQSCTFDVTLFPPPVAIDNCDDDPTVTLEAVDLISNHIKLRPSTGARDYIVDEESIGLDLWRDLTCDTFRLMYVAMDTCHAQNLQDTIFRFVVVQDNILPSAHCVNRFNVGVNDDGTVWINASQLNNNSIDNCRIDSIGVRLKGTNDEFREVLELSCQLGDEPILEVQVKDEKGNSNTCDVELVVQGAISPTISAPRDTIESSCDLYSASEFVDGDITGTELMETLNADFGAPIINNSCELKSNLQSLKLISGDCEFILERTFTITNWDDLSAIATQLIIIRTEPDWELTFPSNQTIACSSLADGQVPAPSTEQEIITKVGSCDKLYINMEEELFIGETQACLRVVRTYTAWNSCGDAGEIYELVEDAEGIVNLNSSVTNAERIIFVQTITVNNSEGPEIAIDLPTTEIENFTAKEEVGGCSSDKIFTLSAKGCLGENLGVSNLILEVRDSIGNTIPIKARVFENEKLQVTVSVGPGTYEVEAWATNACGNSSGMVNTITFVDSNAPTIWLLDGIATDHLSTSGNIEIWAADFVNNITDGCSNSESVVLGIWHPLLGDAPASCEEVANLSTSINFSCKYVGLQRVRVYASDESGNCDYVEAFLSIQDNTYSCARLEAIENDSRQIAGKIHTPSGALVGSVDVFIEGGMTDSLLATGDYQFMVPQGRDYSIRPFKDINPLEGVSTYDIVLISKHILGLTGFTSPYQYIAADLNKSGTITAFDIVILRKLILTHISTIPNNTSWRFIDKAYDFGNDLTTVLQQDFPEKKQINAVYNNSMENDFVGVKMGDINGVISQNGVLASSARKGKKQLTLTTHNQFLKKGETVAVSFHANVTDLAIEGYQFSLDYNELSLENFIEGELSKENINTKRKGSVMASWNGTSESNANLFTLVFTALSSGMLSDLLDIDTNKFTSEAYSVNGELLEIALAFLDNPDESFFLLQNVPNPFSTETQIGFILPSAGPATFSIMDVQGKLLKEITGDYKKGFNQITIKAKDLKSAGVFIYKLKYAEDTATKKLIILQ